MGLGREIREEWAWYRTIEGGEGFWRPLREPGFWIMAVHRLGYRARQCQIPGLGFALRAFYRLLRLFILAITGADIRSGARIGRRFTVHTTQGIVIVDDVQIGDDCVINTGVCVVYRANDRGEGVARIGNHVTLGVGSKILGHVTIGDEVIVGANAVVLHDIPSRSIAVGLPAVAKPMRPKDTPAANEMPS